MLFVCLFVLVLLTETSWPLELAKGQDVSVKSTSTNKQTNNIDSVTSNYHTITVTTAWRDRDRMVVGCNTTYVVCLFVCTCTFDCETSWPLANFIMSNEVRPSLPWSYGSWIYHYLCKRSIINNFNLQNHRRNKNILGLGLWCLTSFPTIFQFYWRLWLRVRVRAIVLG
jgi:hypothetical protein